ncbi:MAG: tRNA pseudouridine(55) synthase TruB [Syntrophaceae bacterium]
MVQDGVVLIDKPAGITSRRALDRVMRILKTKRGGHFGSLDPFATGLLCIGIGQGTKCLPFLQDQPKEYTARIGIEMSTDTDDITGTALASFPQAELKLDKVQEWIQAHTGLVMQTPPDYCAQKFGGTPLYRLKRANQPVTPRAKEIHIAHMEILAHNRDSLEIRIVCSRGTYIRAIARDLGAALGFGGYLRELRRLKSEGFSLEKALTLEELEARATTGTFGLIPLPEALHLPTARVTAAGQAEIMDGRPIQFAGLIDRPEVPDGSYLALVNTSDQLLCVAKVQRQGGIFGFIERGFQPF